MGKKKKKEEDPEELIEKLTQVAMDEQAKSYIGCSLKCSKCIEDYDDHAACHKMTTKEMAIMMVAINELKERVEILENKKTEENKGPSLYG